MAARPGDDLETVGGEGNGLPGEHPLVFAGRHVAGPGLVPGRRPLVHHGGGHPHRLQCFKFAGLSFFPFGKEVVYGGGAASLLLNLVWLLVSGIPLALAAALNGLLLCVTVLGIPFGLQCFKLAKLALMPFGASVR